MTLLIDRTVRTALPSTAEQPEHVSPVKEKHVSAPITSKATLVQLPPRSSSIGRVLPDARPTTPIEAFVANQPAQPTQPAQDHTSRPEPLKREKTKSRIWGLLGGKQKKTQVKQEIKVLRDSDEGTRTGQSAALYK